MKKIVLGFLGLMCFMLPFGVSALEFKDSELLYKYEEVKITCDAFDGNEWFDGVYNDKPVYELNGDYYLISGSTCTKMTQTEVDAYYEYSMSVAFPASEVMYNSEDNTIYDITVYSLFDMGLILTDDAAVDTSGDTTYYYRDDDGNLTPTNDSAILQTKTPADLYDMVFYVEPSSDKAEDGVTYYTVDAEGILAAATVTAGDDISGLDYVVLEDADKLFEMTKIRTLDKTRFADIDIENNTPFIAYNESREILYVYGYNKDTNLFDVYTVDGTKVPKLSGSDDFGVIGDLIYVTFDGTLKIYNSKLELLQEVDGVYYVYGASKSSKGIYVLFEDVNYEMTLYHATTSKLPASPDTFDGVSMYIAMFLISLVGVVSATVCFKKKRHN